MDDLEYGKYMVLKSVKKNIQKYYPDMIEFGF
jgi:hypothetical protein